MCYMSKSKLDEINNHLLSKFRICRWSHHVHSSITQNVSLKPIEIFKRFKAWFEDETLPRVRVFAWHNAFLEGRERVENQSHRRPWTNLFSIIHDHLEKGRCWTVSEIEYQVGISYRNMQEMITDHLEFRKVSSHFRNLESPLHAKIQTSQCGVVKAQYGSSSECQDMTVSKILANVFSTTVAWSCENTVRQS